MELQNLLRARHHGTVLFSSTGNNYQVLTPIDTDSTAVFNYAGSASGAVAVPAAVVAAEQCDSSLGSSDSSVIDWSMSIHTTTSKELETAQRKLRCYSRIVAFGGRRECCRRQ